MATYTIKRSTDVTIGDQTKHLAEIFDDPTGIYILRSALREACKVDGVGLTKIDGMLIQDTPGYKQARRREEELLDRMDEILADDH